MAHTKTNNRPWAGASAHPADVGRAVYSGRAETGMQVVLKALPPEFGDRLHEHKALTSPGVAEGFDYANKLIEGWKNSL